MFKSFAFLLVIGACAVVTAEGTAPLEWEEIAAKAVREAAEKAAREKADAEAAAKATAEEAAKAAAESTVKAAVEKAAKDAAAAAAKAAAEEATKALTDEKAAKEAAKEEEKAAKEEAKENLRQIDTQIFRLVHASAVEVADKLNTMWNGEFGQVWKVTKMAVPFEESNTIVVTAPRAILTACEKIVQGLDIEAKQVYIEARFVELGNTASHKVGIDWSMLGGMTGTATLGGGLRQYYVGNGVTDYHRKVTGKEGAKTVEENYGLSGLQDSDGSITYFNGTLDFSQMALTLKALDATEDVKTFSNPKIIVSSGKRATVDMTTKYPNVKVSAKRTDASGSTSLDIAAEMTQIPGEDKFMFAKESFFSWGISLEVTPRISTNGLINVSIVPTFSSIDTTQGEAGWVVTGNGSEAGGGGTISSKYPIIKVQRLVCEFNLSSGTTAVIGGLSRTEEMQVDNGIPVLRDIPWLGPRLFGSMERVKAQKEIVIFVTVGVVDPHNVSPDAGLPKNAILGRQYTKGQKLEPGDKPEKNMEGFDSLDLRPLEEQAKDPLQKQKKGFSFGDYLPFKKDPEYNNKEK